MKSHKQANFISNKLGISQFFKWFTLVELIVVIVILAILSTIAFLSFNSYSWSARDSKRMANVALISKWFDIAISKWVTVNTSESTAISLLTHNIEIAWSWITLIWYFDSPIKPKLLNSIWVNWSDLTLSDWFQSYRYTYIPSTRQYQVMWLLESAPDTAFYRTILKKVFAEDGWYPFIKWNYVPKNDIAWLIPKSCDPTSLTPCEITWSWDVFIENEPATITEPIIVIEPTPTWCIFDNADSTFDTCTFDS